MTWVAGVAAANSAASVPWWCLCHGVEISSLILFTPPQKTWNPTQPPWRSATQRWDATSQSSPTPTTPPTKSCRRGTPRMQTWLWGRCSGFTTHWCLTLGTRTIRTATPRTRASSRAQLARCTHIQYPEQATNGDFSNCYVAECSIFRDQITHYYSVKCFSTTVKFYNTFHLWKECLEKFWESIDF